MAKAKTNVKSKKSSTISHIHIAFTKKNYMVIGLGILLIIIGYVFMSANSVDGFLPTVIAPILLVAGYCVVIPVGILIKDKSIVDEMQDLSKAGQAEKSVNVKTS